MSPDPYDLLFSPRKAWQFGSQGISLPLDTEPHENTYPFITSHGVSYSEGICNIPLNAGHFMACFDPTAVAKAGTVPACTKPTPYNSFSIKNFSTKEYRLLFFFNLPTVWANYYILVLADSLAK